MVPYYEYGTAHNKSQQEQNNDNDVIYLLSIHFHANLHNYRATNNRTIMR